jgi:exodeoxyribonuclease V alpha subunit
MKSGCTGSRALNVALQAALNPPTAEAVSRFGFSYGVGDKVMQIENDYDKDAMNGDCGFITKIDKVEEEVTVDFDGRKVAYSFGELDELVLSYGFSIHKSQGSEFPCVIMPVSTQHYTMLQRNLIYTGVTRGKSLVICVGTQKALGIAVRNRQTRRRVTKLDEWLRDGSSGSSGTAGGRGAAPRSIASVATAPVVATSPAATPAPVAAPVAVGAVVEAAAPVPVRVQAQSRAAADPWAL